MEVTYSGSGQIYFCQKEYECDLYLNEECGGILVKINVYGVISNFLEFPLEVNFFSGVLSNGFKFTLIGCKREGLNDLIGRGKSIFSYSAQYMVKGIGGKNVSRITFHKVEFQMADIIAWGNISGYSVTENYDLTCKENTEKIIYQNGDLVVKYTVRSSMLPITDWDILREEITLKQYGIIEIAFDEEKAIEEFERVYRKIKRLIEISLLRPVSLKKVTGQSKHNTQTIGKEEYEWPIPIVSSDFFDNQRAVDPKVHQYRWINLSELTENNSFVEYFKKYEVLEPIVELYLEILQSRDMSPVRAFLNITQALETYHARFKASNLTDFRKRIDEVILKNRPQAFIEQEKSFLLDSSKRQLTLQSRLADLILGEFKVFFDTGDINRMEFPSVIAKTRNYYTHYDEAIKNKERVLTNGELNIYNKALLYVLEYYLLLELGFKDEMHIAKKLNDRWGRISQELLIMKQSKEMFNNTQ